MPDDEKGPGGFLDFLKNALGDKADEPVDPGVLLTLASFLPGVGEAVDAGEVVQGVRGGDPLQTLFGGLGLLLPFVGGRGIREGAQGVAKKATRGQATDEPRNLFDVTEEILNDPNSIINRTMKAPMIQDMSPDLQGWIAQESMWQDFQRIARQGEEVAKEGLPKDIKKQLRDQGDTEAVALNMVTVMRLLDTFKNMESSGEKPDTPRARKAERFAGR
jgi:hypothetical protein